MGTKIIKVTDTGDVVLVPLTGGSGSFGNTRITKYATGTLAGAVADAYEEIWENPESVPVIVFRVVVNETSGAGVGAGEYVIIGADATGAGMTGTKIMDGFNANSVAWYDNAYGPVALGATTKKAIVYLNENGGTTSFLTAQYKAQDCSAFAATVHIFYFPVK